MERATASELRRFTDRYVVNGDCWLWTGPLDRDGYGSFYFRRVNRRAHRFAWYYWRGDIPEGMVVNHACRRRHCVNPQHLELLTPRENALRDSASLGAINARKTHCPQGHEYDRRYGGQRYCSICDAAKKKRLRARWRVEDSIRC